MKGKRTFSDHFMLFSMNYVHFLHELLSFFLHFKKFFKCLFLREREIQSVSWGGAEKERETQNLKQAPSSELSGQSPAQGLNSQIVKTVT